MINRIASAALTWLVGLVVIVGAVITFITLMQFADTLTVVAGVIALGEIFVIFGLLGLRTLGNVLHDEGVPLLQARDLLLFGFFVVITIAQQVSRGTGIRFSDYPAWIVFTDLFELSVGTLYLVIEILAIRRRRKTA